MKNGRESKNAVLKWERNKKKKSERKEGMYTVENCNARLPYVKHALNVRYKTYL